MLSFPRIIGVLFFFLLKSYAGLDICAQGTLICPEGIQCGFSSAVITPDQKTVITGNDKEPCLYAFDLADLMNNQNFIQKKPMARIRLNGQYGVKKIESTTRFGNWILVVPAFSVGGISEKYEQIIAFKWDSLSKKGTSFHSITKDNIKKRIQTLMGKMPHELGHIKIEASAIVATIDQNKTAYRMRFGIREMGPSRKNFSYKIMVISCDIYDHGSGVTLGSNWRIDHDYSAKMVGWGISDMAYGSLSNSKDAADMEKKPFFTLSRVTKSGGRKKYDGALVRAEKNGSLSLLHLFSNHKVEGLAFFDQYWIVIADEDRATPVLKRAKGYSPRKMNEAPYWILKSRPVARHSS